MITNIIAGKPGATILTGAKENENKNSFTGFSQLLALIAGSIPNESKDASSSGKSIKGLLQKYMQSSPQKFNKADASSEALKIFEIINQSPDISNDYISSSKIASEYIQIKGNESNQSKIPHQSLTHLMRFIMTSDGKILNNNTLDDTLLIEHLLNPITTSQNKEIKSLLSKYASELNIESVQIQLPDHASITSIKQLTDMGIKKENTFRNKDIIPNKESDHVNTDTEKIKLMPENLGRRLLKINQIKINQKENFNDSYLPEVKSALLDHALKIEKYSIAKSNESFPQLDILPDMQIQKIYKAYPVNIKELPISFVIQAKIKKSISSTQTEEQALKISESPESTSFSSTSKTSYKADLSPGMQKKTLNLSELLIKSNEDITQASKNIAQSTNSLKTGTISAMEVEIPTDSDKSNIIPTANLSETNIVETKRELIENLAQYGIKTDSSDLQAQSTENTEHSTTSPNARNLSDKAVEFTAQSDKATIIPEIKQQVINFDTPVDIPADSDKPAFIPEIKEQVINSDMASKIQEQPIKSTADFSETGFNQAKGELIENVAQSVNSPKTHNISDKAAEIPLQTDIPTSIPEIKEQVINFDMASKIQEQPIKSTANLSENGFIQTKGELIENLTQSGMNSDSFSSDLQTQSTENAAQSVNSPKTQNISDKAAEIPLQKDIPAFISETKEQHVNDTKASEIKEQPIKANKSFEVHEQPIESASHKILNNKEQVIKSNTTGSETNVIETNGQSIDNLTEPGIMNFDSSGLKVQSTENTKQSNSIQKIQNQPIPHPEMQEQPIMHSELTNLKKQSRKHIEVKEKSSDDLMQSVKSEIVSESTLNKSPHSFKEQDLNTTATKQNKGIKYDPEKIGHTIKNPQASENLNASENTYVSEHLLAIDKTNQENALHRQFLNKPNIENSIEKLPNSQELKPAGDTHVFQPQIIKGPIAEQISDPLTSQINTSEIDQGNITELVNKTLHLFKSNESNVKIQLRPKEFGRMQMQINQNENSINLEIITENILAKNMIEGYLPELKAALLEHGLNLTRHTIIAGDTKPEHRKENKNHDQHDKKGKKYPKNAKKSKVSKTNKPGSFTI